MKTFITSIIVAAMMLLVVTSAATAEGNKVGATYTPEYRWHGFKVFGDEYVHPGIATTIEGIEAGAVTHIGNDHEDIEYWDSSAAYKLPLIAGLELRAGYDYLIFPGTDIQELSATISLPGVITPAWSISHIIPDEANAGQIYTVGANVNLGDPKAISAVLGASATYNDGVNPWGPIIRDWTHATAGLKLHVPITQTIAIQPAVYYQHAFEPEALQCSEDECWYSIGLTYQF
jgi:hypothetical protein